MNETTIFDINIGSGGTSIDHNKGDIIVDKTNFSFSTSLVPSILIRNGVNVSKVSFNSIINNTATSWIVAVHQSTNSIDYRCNFIGNTCKNVIDQEVDGSLQVIECIIIDNSISQSIFGIYGGSLEAIHCFCENSNNNFGAVTTSSTPTIRFENALRHLSTAICQANLKLIDKKSQNISSRYAQYDTDLLLGIIMIINLYDYSK
ncbi:hypothetical protein TVAG_101200 [Trichomonas vaginalis G3]|uniref:Uncharacterized protein n=1 Tax=Trichomonas vaginalis (strain ATCC PRA-98 / G3) TaxID=412133 RepID=A2DJK2_TRIV3|nr:hypothetical protein TVAGG3_1035950 [Trichomonas vaginalis G3]EAY19402.1 hypothetical protein TVAG_101200 [Trichomonas vaginalis G3]KAI5493200.1 hypothetical protein TVAGG3_1035950 [Trichomonas vaginalis G3]|eukprot:XP_001580388.1 hypothetical protein [Trichomonas vaginalis G3]